MAKTRKNASPSVALFPFLAVLMCTMGSLILLLLVTSRQIRERALEELERPVAIGLPPAPEIETPERHLQPVVRPLPVAPPRLNPVRPAAPPAAEPIVDDFAEQAAALRREWQARVDQLEAQLEAHERALRERTLRLKALDADRGQLAANASSLQVAQRETESQHRELVAEQRKLLLEREEVAGSLTELEQRLEELRAARVTASSKFSMVAYNGVSGTALTPIVIECTAKAIAFPAEGVALTPDQISGFSPAHNPLQSGVAALAAIQLRDSVNRDFAPERPYVLLLVRPDGTEAYYIARTLLADYPAGFGVELIPADMELQWPTANPEEAAALSAAISKTLSERGRFIGSRRNVAVTGPAGKPMDVAGRQGNFQLPEVEELRQESPKKVFFGNREVVRETVPRGSPDPSLSRGAPSVLAQTPPTKAAGRSNTSTQEASPATSPFPQTEPSGSGPGQDEAERLAPRRKLLLPPDMSEPSPRSRRPSPSQVSAAPRRWGQGAPAGRIGYEHDLVIEVHQDRLIAEDVEIDIPRGANRDTVRELFAAIVDASVRSWGQAPAGFYWLPRVSLQVFPGGNVHTARLKGLADEWGLNVKIEQRLE